MPKNSRLTHLFFGLSQWYSPDEHIRVDSGRTRLPYLPNQSIPPITCLPAKV